MSISTKVAVVVALAALGFGGCSGETLLAYIGGGLPPGDGDIGGVVLAAVGTAGVAAQATAPVVGAKVALQVGGRQVGETTTGEGGYFRFERPRSGRYTVIVTAPPHLHLQQARHQFQHQFGQQTFLTIILQPAP